MKYLLVNLLTIHSRLMILGREGQVTGVGSRTIPRLAWDLHVQLSVLYVHVGIWGANGGTSHACRVAKYCTCMRCISIPCTYTVAGMSAREAERVEIFQDVSLCHMRARDACAVHVCIVPQL